MSSLLQWVEMVTAAVEQDGVRVERIKLLSTEDGQVWNTWVAPFAAPSELSVQMEGYLRSLQQEWPTQQIGILWVAFSRDGETLSQLPMRVQGEARKGRVDSIAAANAVAFDSLAKTFEKMQHLTHSLLDQARLHQESNVETIVAQTQLIQLYRAKEIEGTADGPTATEKLLESHLPDLMELGKLYLETQQKKKG